jgi:hypothetical protein
MTLHNPSQSLRVTARSDADELTSAKASESGLSFAEASESEDGDLYAIEYPSVSGTTGTRAQLSLFPARVSAFIHRHQGRPLKIGLMTLIFITALFSKSYTGDYQMIINNHIGGILYVLFGSLAFSALFPRMRIFFPVIFATGATCLLEFVQWFRIPFMTELTRIKAFAYLFGNSFNPGDFLYYGAGAVMALLVLWFIRED